MTYRENIKLALQSIKGNLLRTVLTSLIIAIGIMALVGILTSIDGIKKSITESFSSMGSNSFTIRNRESGGIRIGKRGSRPKRFEAIKYEEAMAFKESFDYPATVSVSANISFASSVKYQNTKTNPNITISSGDENYLQSSGYKLKSGRNFSSSELEYGSNVTIIGKEMADKLFENSDPINKLISIGSEKFLVIGELEEKGSSFGFGGDKVCIVPVLKGKKLSSAATSFSITVLVNNIEGMDNAIGEATGLFRNIRKLSAKEENNFEPSKSDSLANSLIENLSFITLAATVIGIITLFGAAIGLMNIMLVSVTERTREIGIRKAIGATPTVIRRQFLIEALVICQIGGIAGIILGIIIGNVISMLVGGGFIVPWLWMFGGIALCVLVGLASGLYPAIKASRLDPVEALRYE